VIVVDTHAWIWWVSKPDKLGRKARSCLERATEIGLSAISVWEAAMLVARGRIRLDRSTGEWIRDALAVDRLRVLPVDAGTALTAATIGAAIHYDPADRLIVATALEAGAPLITKDAAITGSGIVRCVW
jgi:PIN domain nuclease of toxin-antitoxin system